MHKSSLLARAIIIGASLGLGSAIGGAAAVTDKQRYIEVNETTRQRFNPWRYPRSRKTRTAAQLKRAAVRRRNIAKRGKK